MLSKLTLMGMHNYAGEDLWQNLDLPTGLSKDTFIDEVLLRGSEFSLLYPDEDYMIYMIGHWSRKWHRAFARWLAAEEEDYNALYNLDVEHIETETGTNTENARSSGQGAGSSNAHEIGTETNEHSRSAMDSSVYQPTEKDVRSPNIHQNTSTTTTTKSESTRNDEHDILRNIHRFGNQGVTMSQEMLLAEYNVRLFNLYEKMADIFINEFCICVYQ